MDVNIQRKPRKPRCFKQPDGRWFVAHDETFKRATHKNYGYPRPLIYVLPGAPMATGATPAQAIQRFFKNERHR